MIHGLIEQTQELSVKARCELAGVSRSGFYRSAARASQPAGGDSELLVRDEIQRICLEFPCYGYRRVSRELKRRGFAVNHKRVLKLMRQDNLLCLRKRRFVKTTNSVHGLPVYPNLAKGLIPHCVNQLWLSDITYIRA